MQNVDFLVYQPVFSVYGRSKCVWWSCTGHFTGLSVFLIWVYIHRNYRSKYLLKYKTDRWVTAFRNVVKLDWAWLIFWTEVKIQVHVHFCVIRLLSFNLYYCRLVFFAMFLFSLLFPNEVTQKFKTILTIFQRYIWPYWLSADAIKYGPNKSIDYKMAKFCRYENYPLLSVFIL